MKMPPVADESTDNGIFTFEENTLTIANEGIENGAAEEFETPAENDFAEYMWMENEEEFDKEVMQRLEEEALMEECIAYMNNENNEFSNNEGTDEEPPQPVSTTKLNPEAAEFIPAARREPPLEETNTPNN